MSIQAGLWFFDGRPVDEGSLFRVADAITEYEADGSSRYLLGSVGMIYRPFHTTTESRLETQPHVSRCGNVVMWDGRLDNREELICELAGDLVNKTDVGIVGEAYDRWGTECFRKFLGDWALSIWQPAEKTLILARDYMAIRCLYYHLTREAILWCTHLTPLIHLSGGKLTLNNEYIAGYLVSFPEAHITPYQEIRAVPPSKFVTICRGTTTVQTYWVFEPKGDLRCKTDAEYEEGFRHVFRQAVRRCLRSDSPILAELSGGFDSSSIVCMADDILCHEGAQTPGIDTISYYDLSEPDGDDFRYFTKVEEKRGRKGFRIDLEKYGVPFILDYPTFLPTPGLAQKEDLQLSRKKIIQEGGYRVTLSGVGGDELNGQSAEFRMQIADLIARFQFRELMDQLKAWSFLTRRPWIQLLFESAIQLAPTSLRVKMAKGARLEPWIDQHFARQHHLSRRQLGEVEGASYWRPSLRDWAMVITSLARQMACHRSSIEEHRCPYLDRDFVQFVTSIPAEQLLRPGERRSLMRRALAKLLPPEVLIRRTKAGAGRAYILMMEQYWQMLEPALESPLAAHLGYINPVSFRDTLRAVKNGIMSPYVVQVMRGLSLELWLRDVVRRGILSSSIQETLLISPDLLTSRA